MLSFNALNMHAGIVAHAPAAEQVHSHVQSNHYFAKLMAHGPGVADVSAVLP